MTQKLISASNTTLSWVYLIAATVFLLVMLGFLVVFLIAGTDALYFIPFLAVGITYFIYSARLYEVSYDEQFIYTKSIFKGIKKFSMADFNKIESKVFLMNVLKIDFNDGNSYSFTPKIKQSFSNIGFNAVGDFINYWNSFFNNNKA